MNRPLLQTIAAAFSAGILVPVFFPQIAHNAPAFLTGIGFTIAAQLVALSSRSRLRKTSAILATLAGETVTATKTKRPETPAASDLETEVTSALVNMGATRKNAASAAAATLKTHPAADFRDAFRSAVTLLQN